MKIETVRFGEVDVEEQTLFRFPTGLLGLEDITQYALIQPDKTLPFAYLQAVQEPGLSLMLADPFAFFRDYEFDLHDADLLALGEPSQEQLSVWVTVNARETLQTSTANLMGPILLNTARQLGRQVILHDSPYKTKTPLLSAPKEAK
jgi:flagellar assembly factor FliW